MIYQRTLTGTDGKGVNSIVDTASPGFNQRMRWIADKTGADAMELEPYTVVDGINGQTRVAVNVKFIFPGNRVNDRVSRQDAFLCNMDPMVAVFSINLELNLGLTQIPPFMDTPVREHVEDWEAPGSPIGPPIASAPKHFKYLHTGQSLGDVITGPTSGMRYTLSTIGGFAFFTMPAWKLVD